MKPRMYYDLNVQIWEESGVFLYSVIQEFSDVRDDNEVLARGEVATVSEAKIAAREAMLEALS